MKWLKGIYGAVVCLAICVSGCGDPESAKANGTSKANQRELTVVLVPSEDSAKMIEGFEPIRAHVESELGRPVKVLSVTDYASAIEAMKRGKADIAWFGPLSLHIAIQEASAEAFAIGMDVKKGAKYFSTIVVSADSPFQKLADLKGKTMAFVDTGSTSGYLVPASYVLSETGMPAEQFFSKTTFAGSHDASLLALKAGNVDACAVQDVTFDDAAKKGIIDATKFRVIFKSDPLPQSPLAFRGNLDIETKEKVRAAILDAHTAGVKLDVPGMGKMEKFVAATNEDYKVIATMVDNLKLSKDQLVK